MDETLKAGNQMECCGEMLKAENKMECCDEDEEKMINRVMDDRMDGRMRTDETEERMNRKIEAKWKRLEKEKENWRDWKCSGKR